MSHVIIDRRKNDKGKSTDNRQRFFRRIRTQVKEPMKELIVNGSIKDIIDGSGKKVKIPGRGLGKPFFGHSKHGGSKHIVVPGNKEYIAGDRIQRPRRNQQSSGSGSGSGAGDGESEDEFEFTLTEEEFMDMFFDDLELPNLNKKNLAQTQEFESRRAGFAPEGNKLNVTRTMRKARGRRVALRSKKKKRLAELEAQYNELLKEPILSEYKKRKLKTLEREIKILKERIKRVPFIDNVDELYNRWEQVPVPTTKAVMFALMDVSGSMGEREKDLSKRFFMLLYWFLQRSYKHVEVVFVRHTQIAKEVDEQEFFYSRESGGTVVSSGIQKIDEIIEDRYPLNEWNIYGCQASDGDNWPGDSNGCKNLLEEKILPKCQYYAYIQIDSMRRMREHTELWKSYINLKNSYSNFDMTSIKEAQDIYPVFHKLFKKRGA